MDTVEDRKIVCWCRTQASSHNSQGVVDNRVDEAGVSTAAPDRSAVQYFSVEWTRQWRIKGGADWATAKSPQYSRGPPIPMSPKKCNI